MARNRLVDAILAQAREGDIAGAQDALKTARPLEHGPFEAPLTPETFADAFCLLEEYDVFATIVVMSPKTWKAVRDFEPAIHNLDFEHRTHGVVAKIWGAWVVLDPELESNVCVLAQKAEGPWIYQEVKTG